MIKLRPYQERVLADLRARSKNMIPACSPQMVALIYRVQERTGLNLRPHPTGEQSMHYHFNQRVREILAAQNEEKEDGQ